jgi:hypothetical protein
VRTLVVSDLHLGARLGHDVLRRPVALHHLLEALRDVDRLVLLGDVVELVGRPEEAMEVAEPVLRAIGERLGAGREVILVAGNHDHGLVRPWLREHADGSLAVDSLVPLDATPWLSQIAEWLAPARVVARYPGVWLSERVWATHGHYLDRHLVPIGAFGFARGSLRGPARDEALPSDYERARGPVLTQLEGVLAQVLPRPLVEGADSIAELIRAATMPGMQRRLLRPQFAPVTSHVLGIQVRRASIPALGRVVHRLAVDADWVVFGHVHRLGPVAGEDAAQWRGHGARPRFVNTGSWVYEPRLVHRATPPHPYWPGGAIVLDGEEPPRPVALLDELDAAALH